MKSFGTKANRCAAARRANRRGKAGEREVGRALYEAWFGEPAPARREHFARHRYGMEQPKGDLTVPDGFPFRVSVKNYGRGADPPPHGFLTGNRSLLAWWGEIDDLCHADGCGRLPLLCWRSGGRWWCAWQDVGWPAHCFRWGNVCVGTLAAFCDAARLARKAEKLEGNGYFRADSML